MKSLFSIQYEKIKKIFMNITVTNILEYQDEQGNIQGGYYIPKGLNPELKDTDFVDVVVICNASTFEYLKTLEGAEFVGVLEE